MVHEIFRFESNKSSGGGMMTRDNKLIKFRRLRTENFAMENFPEMNADLQVLMEQLRQRSHSLKSWSELIKAAKTNLKEKRSPLDAEDRAQIQQCLDILHKTVNVGSSKDLFEHIEELAVKSGLSLAPSPSSAHGRFVMSECFFLEIQAKETGVVDKVFINHGQMTCSKSSSLLVSLINERKWDEVGRHLEGLVAGYNVAGEKSLKIEAFNALQALEHNVEMFVLEKKPESSARVQILRSQVGAVRPREAGRFCRLHYFIAPHDSVDDETQSANEPALKDAFEREIGLWAELHMASSNDVIPLVTTFRKESGSMSDSGSKSLTTKLPAMFSLSLSEPMVVRTNIISEWEAMQVRPSVINAGNYIELVQQKAECNGDVFCVNLPDQKHIYILDSASHDHLDASLISSIELSDVNHLPAIIASLRTEALLGFVLKSIIQEAAPKQKANHIVFETTSRVLGQIDCVFESDGRICKVRFTAEDLDQLNVEVLDLNENVLKKHAEGTAAFQRSWSIPIALGAILKTTFPELMSNEMMDSNGDKDDAGKDDDAKPNEDSTDDDHKNGRKRPANGDDTNGHEDDYAPPKKFAKFDAKAAYDSVYRIVCESMPALVDVQLLQEMPEINLPPTQNMLDLFKEIEIWEALIPPRPGQKPLKSPAPQAKRPFGLPPFPAPTSQQQPMPSPMFSAAPVGAPASIIPGMGQGMMGSQRSPKPRHLSSASDTFEEMNELCNLSKAFADPENAIPRTPVGAPGSVAGTPINERPSSLVLERKSSIQDTIDSVLGSALQPGHCGTPIPPTAMAQSPIGMADNRHRMGVGPERGGGQSMSFDQSDLSGVPHPIHQHHSRSLSLAGASGFDRNNAGSTTTINLDVFDFDKSDQFEMESNMGGANSLQRWHSFHEMDSLAAPNFPVPPGSAGPPMTPGFDIHSGIPLSPAAAFRNMSTTGVRGGRGGRGGGTGRRRSRRALNVGDRTMEFAMKELKKAERISRGGTGTRRPRRPRGSSAAGGGVPSAQIVTSSFGEDSTKFTLKILQPGSSGNNSGGGSAVGTHPNPNIFGGQEMLGPQASTVRQQMQQQQSFHFMQQQAQQHHQSLQPQYSVPTGYAEPNLAPTTSYGEDSEDAAELAKAFPDSTGGDEILRQQIQALRQQMLSNVNFGNLDDRSSDAGLGGAEKSSGTSTPSSGQRQQSTESTEFDALGGNLFDNLASASSFGQPQSESAGAGGTPANLSNESLVAKIRASVKRRGSLDTVIGKLMADKTSVTVSSDEQTFLTNSSESTMPESFHQPPKRIRLDLDDDGSQSGGASDDFVIGASLLRKEESGGSSTAIKDSGESTPEGASMGGGEGIKLVIKKSAIKNAANKPSVGRPPSVSKQLKLDKLSPSGMNPKRASPNVTEWTKGGQQQAGEQKQTLAQPSNRGFETLKQKMQEKKLKKQAAAKLANELGTVAYKQPKVEKAKPPKVQLDQQFVEKKATAVPVQTAANEKTPPKSAPPTAVPGAEAISFTKSLKGFKIPKIDDSASMKPPATAANVPAQPSPSNKEAYKKPPYQPQPMQAPMPKPILKHSVSTPAPATLASLMAANSFIPIPSLPSNPSPPVAGGRMELSPTFRPYMRRTLLPDPTETASTASPNLARMVGPYGMLSDRFSTDLRDRDAFGMYAGPSAAESAPSKAETFSTQRSPDNDGLVIDDNPKSPNASLNTSKESIPSPAYRSTAFPISKEDEERILMDPATRRE